MSRLCWLDLTTPEEKVKEHGKFGEDGDKDVVGVLVEDDWLLDRDEACCSRSRRRRCKADERSKASVLRPDADRLARRAFAWLVETVREGKSPSWERFRRVVGEGTLEKRPALKPGIYVSMMPVVLVPKAFK